MRRLLGLLVVAGLGSVTASGAPPPSGAVLFLSADVRGYLGPCGCSENMRGGIGRAAAQVLEARAGPLPVLYLDGGDSLFGEPKLPAALVPQEELKARTLARAMVRMGLAARGTGELDDARGASFRKALGLPELPAGGVRLLDAAGRKLGVVSASTAAQLVDRSAKARKLGAGFVLAFFHGSLPEAQRAAGRPGLEADLVVATHTASEFAGEENRSVRAEVPVVALQSKGRSLLRVDLRYGARGGTRFVAEKTRADTEREVAAIDARLALLDREVNRPGIPVELKALKQGKVKELVARRQALLSAPLPPASDRDGFGVRFIPLDSTLPSHPDVQKLVAEYDREVGALNVAWAKAHGRACPPALPGQAAYVGNALCKTCHAEAFAHWETTLHSRAWETLQAEGKQLHLNCIGCHVTGWQQAGGACRVDQVAGREDVGCEGCHGPGSLHVDNPTAAPLVAAPKASVCVACHNRENSPHFDFALYLPRVLGPGHGAGR